MTSFQIFFLQFGFALLVLGALAWKYVWPRLNVLLLHAALLPLAFVHSFRFIGMVFLVPGVVGSDMPRGFLAQAAYGDLLTAILAFATVLLLLRNSPAAIGLAWIYNIVGFVDLLNAFYKGITQVNHSLFGQLGAGWYVPTVIVPVLLVTHFMAFLLLTKRRSAAESA